MKVENFGPEVSQKKKKGGGQNKKRNAGDVDDDEKFNKLYKQQKEKVHIIIRESLKTHEEKMPT